MSRPRSTLKFGNGLTSGHPRTRLRRVTGRTIHFVSLGCAKNRVDTEVMLGVSDLSGYSLVDDPKAAEVIVVNTCGFIESAKQESIDTILQLADHKEDGSCQRLVVAGCLSQRYPEQLARELPEVDHFLGSSDMLKLGHILRLDAAQETSRMLVGNPADYTFRLQDPRRLSLAVHSAYVKIAEGCSRKCGFCAIPSFRGTQRSRPIEDVIGEVQRLVSQGTVEINLISQDTVSYGRDLSPRSDLTALIDALCKLPRLRWLRLFYLYPEQLDDALLERFADTSPVVPYVDMPFQHGSDAMLKRMRRGYRASRQREIIDRLRTLAPDVSLRTSFILGHPGETEADFDELLDLVRFAEFDHVGLFRYSHEEGTHSGTMENDVEPSVIDERYNELMTIQKRISKKRLRRFVGREIEVLIEGESEESEWLLQGRHAGQAPEVDGVVHLVNGTTRPGELRKVLITHAGDYDLVGDLSCGTDSPDGPPRKRRLPSDSPDGPPRKRRLPLT